MTDHQSDHDNSRDHATDPWGLPAEETPRSWPEDDDAPEERQVVDEASREDEDAAPPPSPPEPPGEWAPPAGPLSQALAAAKNVISSLQEPVPGDEGAPPREEAPEEQRDEPAAEEPEAATVAEDRQETMAPEGPEEATAADEPQAATVAEGQTEEGLPEPALDETGGEEGEEEREEARSLPTFDLPEEPPPWMVDEPSTEPTPQTEPQDTGPSWERDVPEETTPSWEQQTPERADDAGSKETTSWWETSPRSGEPEKSDDAAAPFADRSDPFEEGAASPYEEPAEAEEVEAAEEPEATGEEPGEMLIELEEDEADEDLERLAAELAEFAGPEDELVVEEVPETEAVLEETEDDEPLVEESDEPDPAAFRQAAWQTEHTPDEPEAPVTPSLEEVESAPEEDQEEADTTPAAYAELASSMPKDEQEQAPAGDRPDVEAGAPGDRRVAVEWGALWRESAQGWVEDEEGQATWRPIVATAAVLSEWEVDTYLGVVGGEAAVNAGKDLAGGLRSIVGGRSGALEKEVARGRTAAVRSMVDDAVARGAHGVLGVQIGYEFLGSVLLVVASGTAVTLKSRS